MNEPAKKRVLLAEHDPELAEKLGHALIQEGYDVAFRITDIEALREATLSPPDVVLVDPSLPNGGGELIEMLEEAQLHCPVILISRDPVMHLEREAMERGAFDVVLDPLRNLTSLMNKIRRACEVKAAMMDRDRLLVELARRNETIRTLESNLNRQRENGDEGTRIDPVIGIWNHRSIEELFRSEAARALRYARPVSIALLGIDALRAIRARRGAEAGSEAFRSIAAVSCAAIRDTDAIGRWDEDRLLLVLPETSKIAGVRAAERLRLLIAGTCFEAGEGENLTVSFGLASLPTDTMNGDQLLKLAEAMLLRATIEGANRVYRRGET